MPQLRGEINKSVLRGPYIYMFSVDGEVQDNESARTLVQSFDSIKALVAANGGTVTKVVIQVTTV